MRQMAMNAKMQKVECVPLYEGQRQTGKTSGGNQSFDIDQSRLKSNITKNATDVFSQSNITPTPKQQIKPPRAGQSMKQSKTYSTKVPLINNAEALNRSLVHPKRGAVNSGEGKAPDSAVTINLPEIK